MITMPLIYRLQQEFATLKASDRRALLIVMAFLVIVGSYVYVLEPLVLGYEQAQTSLENLSAKQRRYARQVAMLPRREAKLAEYRSEREALTRRFNLQVASLEQVVAHSITELTYYARLANITVSGIRPLEQLVTGDLREIPFELEALGDYEDLRKFFYYIDTSPSLLAITDLDLSAGRQGPQQARIKLSNLIRLNEDTATTVPDSIAPHHRLRLGLSRWTGYAPLVVAKHNGYLDSVSMKVDFLQVDDHVTLERLLASGEVDVIGTSFPALLGYWVKGIPLTIILPLDRTSGTEGIVVRPGSPIKTVTDLHQQRVAVDKGGILEFVLFQALEEAGLSLSDVQLESLPASQVARDIGSGTLEVGLTREPFLSTLLNNKQARVIYTSNDQEGLILDLLAVTPEAATKKSTVIQALVKGVLKAQEFIMQNPDRALEIVANWEGQPLDMTQSSLAKLTLFDTETTQEFFTGDRLAELLATFETYFDTIEQPFPLVTHEDIATMTYFNQVTEQPSPEAITNETAAPTPVAETNEPARPSPDTDTSEPAPLMPKAAISETAAPTPEAGGKHEG